MPFVSWIGSDIQVFLIKQDLRWCSAVGQIKSITRTNVTPIFVRCRYRRRRRSRRLGEYTVCVVLCAQLPNPIE